MLLTLLGHSVPFSHPSLPRALPTHITSWVVVRTGMRRGQGTGSESSHSIRLHFLPFDFVLAVSHVTDRQPHSSFGQPASHHVCSPHNPSVNSYVLVVIIFVRAVFRRSRVLS